jgi:hypothetical protein
MKICPKCALPAATGAVRCRECGERLPVSPGQFFKELGSYIRSYEVMDWWRFEFCVVGAFVLDAILYFFVSEQAVWLEVSLLVLVIGILVGLVWQWRNRYNL